MSFLFDDSKNRKNLVNTKDQIYGFKIFGMRGSKYELKFDYQGKPINEDEIR